MQKEMVNILDSKGKLTGVIKPKDEAHSRKLWHRAAHIWVYNSKGEVLLQKRAKIKKSWPGKWNISAAGHISAGEEPKIGALRELEEEIGIKASAKDLKDIMIIKTTADIKNTKFYEREFVYIYFLKHDKLPTKLQKDEVDEVRFISIKKFESDLKNKKSLEKYVPLGKPYYLMILNRIKEEISPQKSAKDNKK